MKYIVLYQDPKTGVPTYCAIETPYGKTESAKIFNETNPSVKSFKLAEASSLTEYKAFTTVKEVP